MFMYRVILGKLNQLKENSDDFFVIYTCLFKYIPL